MAATCRSTAHAQVLAAAERAPRFYVASADQRVLRETRDVEVLRRRVSVVFDGVPLSEALETILSKANLRLVYTRDILPVTRVSLAVKNITVAAALTEVLFDTGLDVIVSTRGQMTIVRRQPGGVSPVGTLVGRVTDAKAGKAISGVEVFLAGTRWRTTTDSGGSYRLANVDTGTYTLTARRLGYTKQTRQVTVREEGHDTVDLVLDPSIARLDELVSTATGVQRRRDIANDVTVLNADSIVRGEPIRSVTDLLQGRVPGLVVQRTSGAPGDPARLRLRGAASPLRSNDPIVVVDGIRVYAEQSAARSANLANIAAGGTGRTYAAPSPLDYIDPNTIETIEVLKGPSAATLYGQDAANGVIVITTKKGKAGPTRWTASADYGQTRMEGDFPTLLMRWGHSLLTNQPLYCPIGDLKQNITVCQADSVVSFQLLSTPGLTVLDKGRRTALSLGASGGNATVTYDVTGSFQDELGLIKLPSYAADDYQARVGTAVPDWMRRPQHFKTWGINGSFRVRLGPTADLSLQTTFARQHQQRSSLEQQLGALMTTYFDQASGIYYRPSTTEADGRKDVAASGFALLDHYYERATAVATNVVNGANFNWRPRSWLAVTADAGLNLVQRSDEVLLPHLANPADTGGRLASGSGTTVVSTVNLRANTNAPLGRGFQVRVAAGVQYTGTSNSDQSLATKNLATGTSLRGDSIVAVNRSLEDVSTFGWYVEPSIGHPRFTFTAGLRLDGGNSYGSGVNGLSLPKFPKLGFTYIPSDESWFPFKSLFQSLRVRVAYGKASRQPGITDRLRVYSAAERRWEDVGITDVVFLQSLGNPELRPERTTEFEGGFDADFIDGRVTLTMTGYRKTTDDALLPVPVAPSVYGAGVSVLRNIGVIRNTGLEFTLGTQLVRSGPVTWGTQLLLSQNRNVVVRLGPGMDPFYISEGGSPSTTGESSVRVSGFRVVPGYPLFGRWAIPTVGYADANGNGILETREIVLGDTAVYVGQTLPNYTASFSTTVSLWRGAVALTAGFQHENGLSQQNAGFRELRPFLRGANDPTASLAEQVVVMSEARNFHETQTVSTTRFNTLAVTYTLPMGAARRLGAERLSLSLQGSNLGLWTNYRGLDPNVNSRSTGNFVVGGAILPQPRLWQVRVNATY